MKKGSIEDIAIQLMQAPKGILAADESSKTCDKRFEELGIPKNPEMRRQYRQLLFTTPNFAKYISGVILFEETINQKDDNGNFFIDTLSKEGVLPGIKVDRGLVELDNFPEEMYTEGLDGLSDRVKVFADMGAKFTKWRCVFQIDTSKKLPSSTAIHANLNVMARYASIAQSNGLVPIVEPEILYDGYHTIERCRETLSQVLRVLFDLLKAYRVNLRATILKSSMVMGGKSNDTQSSPEEVAQHTIRVFEQRIPDELAGIVFLSGGQSPDQATQNLGAIENLSTLSVPITFSFSRALQEPAMKAWAGKSKNSTNAQAIFEKRLKYNSDTRI